MKKKIKNNVLISVIIPTYNRSFELKRAITSILKQTYKNFELLIIDDGSTENILEVVNSFNDKRIIYIKKENSGVCDSRNLGIKKAKGEYISLLDSDDEYLENRLEKQINDLIYFNVDFSISGKKTAFDGIIINDKKNKINNKIVDIYDIITGKVSISATFMMFKKSLNIYFDNKFPSSNDLDFILQVNGKSNILYIPEELNINHKTDKIPRISTNNKSKIEGYKQLLLKLENNGYSNLSEKNIILLKIKVFKNLFIFNILDGNYIEGRRYFNRIDKSKFGNLEKIKMYILYYLSYSKILIKFSIFVGKILWKFNLLKI